MPTRLAELLSPLTVAEFLTRAWGLGPVHVRGAEGRFTELMPWSQLGQLLAHHRIDPQRLRVYRDGAPFRTEQLVESLGTTHRKVARVTRLRAAALLRELRRGATLVLDSVDELHPPIAELAAALEAELGDPVMVNLYATWHVTRGFGLHWDDHDVLVLQVAGRKRWAIFGPTRPAPLHDDVAPVPAPDGDPACEPELAPGDVLYIPRGHWHYARPTGEPTLHLTFGVYRRTGVDLIRWLADQLRDDELFRRDLPRPGPREALEAHLGRLRDALLAQWDDAGAMRFLRAHDRATVPRPSFDLPWAATEELLPPVGRGEIRIDLLRPARLEAADLVGEVVELQVQGRTFPLTGDDLVVVRALADGAWRLIDDLCRDPAHRLPPERVRAALRRLCVDGLCVTRS